MPHPGARHAAHCMISEHASPLASIGSVDSGGQNVYVAHLARQLGKSGYLVDVFTRRDKALLPDVVAFAPNVRVIHVPAGPAVYLPKEQLLPYMAAFGDFMVDFMRRDAIGYDVLHANFFMSGVAAMRARQVLDIPLVMTFHALGKVRRLHQGSADGFPDNRFEIEDELVRHADRIVAECPQDLDDLVNLYHGDPARIDVVPCGFDEEEFAPLDRHAARRALDWDADAFTVLQLGRLVPRKGIDNVIRAIGCLRRDFRIDARLYVVGGNAEQPNVEATPEIGRLQGVAEEAGVQDCVTFVGRRRGRSSATSIALRMSSSPHRGTSRSASRRSRPWHAACRSLARTWGASARRWSTAKPATWCRPVRPRRWPTALRGWLATAPWRGAWAWPACAVRTPATHG